MNKENKITFNLIILIIFAVVFRFILSAISIGFYSDVNLFLEWANRISEFGPEVMYLETSNCDYPPGYLYVLWGIGEIINWLSTVGAGRILIELVLMLPPMLCDILSALLIYKLALEKHDDISSLIIMALYLFNPAVLLNSSAWGQVDSVLAFIILLTVYLVYKKKMCWAYLSFCIGFFMKPQTIFIAPVVLLGILDTVFLNGFSVKRFFKHLICGLGSILLCIVLCLPFDLNNVIVQYRDTITSFPKASLCAYNLWTIFGLNWQSQETPWLFGAPAYMWGYFFIVAICLIVLYVWYYEYRGQDERKNSYFYLGALIIVCVFTFSVRMHERYMFPALALLLAYCAISESKKNYRLYVFLSVLHYINVYIIYKYYYYPYDYDYSFPEAACGIFMVGGAVYMIYKAFKLYAVKTKKRIKK